MSSWEAELLKRFCNSDASLEDLGYARHSVLASTWLVATTAKLKRKNNSSATTTGSEDASLNLCGGSGGASGCGDGDSGAKGGVAEGVVRQWVYYYVRRVRTESLWDSLPRDQLKTVLEELNCHLASRVFIVGDQLTLADVLLYYGLHRYMAGMSPNERADCIHLGRWFDQVQHVRDLRPANWPLIVFHKDPHFLKK